MKRWIEHERQHRLKRERGFARGRRRTGRDCPQRAAFIDELLARRRLPDVREL